MAAAIYRNIENTCEENGSESRATGEGRERDVVAGFICQRMTPETQLQVNAKSAAYDLFAAIITVGES